MILVELNQPGAPPEIREISQPQLLRLGVAVAYQAGRPIPASVQDAADELASHSPARWAFHSLDAAGDWVETYRGPRAAVLREIFRHFAAMQPDEAEARLQPEP